MLWYSFRLLWQWHGNQDHDTRPNECWSFYPIRILVSKLQPIRSWKTISRSKKVIWCRVIPKKLWGIAREQNISWREVTGVFLWHRRFHDRVWASEVGYRQWSSEDVSDYTRDRGVWRSKWFVWDRYNWWWNYSLTLDSLKLNISREHTT